MNERKTKAGGKKRKPKTDWIVEVDVRKLRRFLVLLFLLILTAISVFSVVRRFLPIKQFVIEGISAYEEQDLINASGLRRGDRLYGFDEEKIEERIKKECPFLEWARVSTQFPNTVRISVEGKQAQWYIEVSESCYALDGDLFVMTETVRTQGLTKLILPNLGSVMVGKVPTFGESETELKKTLEIISMLRQTTFKTRLSEVDLTSRWDIRLTVDGVYYVTVGDVRDFEAKLRAIEAILGSERAKNSVGGEIDVTVPASPAFRPIYDKNGEES